MELVKSGQLWIRTKSGEIVRFIPNKAQLVVIGIIEELLEAGKQIRLRVLKARQMGLSTLFEAIIFAFTSNREGFNSLVIADDDEGSKKLFNMNKLFHERLDDHLKPELKKSNEIALEFSGLNSRIDIDTARNKNAGRGDTYQIIHKSETSRFPYPKEVNLGISNAVPDLPGTMIFDESTANGMNHFYDDVNKALKELDGYKLIFLPWFYDETYQLTPLETFVRNSEELELADKVKELFNYTLTDAQLNWRRFAIVHKCGGDINLFRQEYPSTIEEAFIFSGRPRFDISILRDLKSRAGLPISKDGLLDIYEPLDPFSKYIIGVDTSEGLSIGDNSSVTILNCKRYSVAAHYQGKIAPDILASYIKLWGEKYNTALAVVESNNHGLVTLNYLKDIYKNIYYRKQYDELSNSWLEKIGWQTSARTKPILISNLDKALRSNLVIKPLSIIEELMTYVIEDDGSTNASEGKTDDNVISLALAVQGYLETQEHTIPEPEKPVLEGTVEHIMRLKKEASKPIHSYQGPRYR